jgi:cytochrome c-type biogenesis protein CcmH/NrfG
MPVPPLIPEAARHPESTDPPAASARPARAAREGESVTAPDAGPPPDLDPETAALRDEILKLHQGLKARSFYELLDVPRKATVREITGAYAKLARKYHPDRIAQVGLPELKEPANAIFIRLGEAKETLCDSEERAWYDRKLASGSLTPATGTPQAGAEVQPGGMAIGWNAANDVIAQARSLLKDEQYWDVIQKMEAAIPLVPDEPQRRIMQVLLAKATLKNPKWVRRAEEQLRRVVSEDPKQVEALLALGQIYRNGGLRARATRMYSRVLQLERRNEEAKAALAELEAQG